MKKIVSLVLAAALMLCLLAGCAAKKPLAPSLFAERYEASRAEISQLTRDEIWELCEDKAVGTVVSVTRVERDYFPVLINLAHDVNAYRAVPIEQWEADHWVVAVKLDEVLEGRTFAYDSYDG
ncbi:MAG: hypothetical protein J6P71_02550, partial [Oscillospiraceae bacterium]|nr:hypothetical protein [Oscillospiraceae bacterium]